MANRVIETRMMAPPTPINTPSTGEMINRVFNDPIFAWVSVGMSGWLLQWPQKKANVGWCYTGSAHPYLIDVLGTGHQRRGLGGVGHQPHPLALSPGIGGVDREWECLLWLESLHLEVWQFAGHVQNTRPGSGSGVENIQIEHLSQAPVKSGLARNQEWRMSLVRDRAVRHWVRLACNGQRNIKFRGQGMGADRRLWLVSATADRVPYWLMITRHRPSHKLALQSKTNIE